MSNPQSTPSLIPISLARVMGQTAVSGYGLDISVAGVPFLLKMSQENPLLRQMVEDRKEQFDNSGEYGEQSFGYWWLRSQASFHGGAGQQFLDTGTVEPALSRIRYSDSLGLYPFVPGQASVPDGLTFTAGSLGAMYVAAVAVERGGQQRLAVLRSDNKQVDFYDVAADPILTGSVATGIVATPLAMATDGVRLFVVGDDSIIRVNADDTLTTIATVTITGTVELGYAKQRLILTDGPKVYEVDPDPATPPAALGTPLFTHGTPSWRWNVVADGPSAIFLAGYAGAVSAVFSMTEQESGGTLVLGVPTEQATLPSGERALSLLFYVNSLFLLGTTTGLRVGNFTPYAQIVWGPESIPGVPVSALAAVGSVVYAGSDDGLFWLDLGSPADAVGRYAYAKQAAVANTLVSVVSVFVSGTLRVFPVLTDTIGYPDPDLAVTATLSTSWITYSTTERKSVHFITVAGDFPAGGKVVVENSEGITQELDIPSGLSQSTFEYGLSVPASDSFQVRLTIGKGGVLRSYQLKALPQPRRYQQLILPLLLEDNEAASNGEFIGYEGFARDRLNLLESLCRDNGVITVKDNLLQQSFQCVIRDVQFRQESGPEPTKPVGGLATVILTLVS